MTTNDTENSGPSAAIETEVQRLVDVVHDLLNGPDGQGQLDYSFEKERVIVDIPKAWVVLAAWLAIKERKRRAGKLDDSAFMRPDSPDHVDKHVRTWARRYLWRLIHDRMHWELHELAVMAHPYLFPEEQKKREAPDLDDGIPF